MFKFYLLITTFLIPLIISCAGIDVVRIGSDDTLEKASTGFRYYQPAPFLFIHSDGKGGLTSEIIFLPDTNEKMSIRPYAYFAFNETTISFDKGILTQAVADIDETAVASSGLEALGKILGSVAIAALNAPETTNEATVPTPYLFKIIIKGDDLDLVGGQAIGPDGNVMVIHTTIVRQENKK